MAYYGNDKRTHILDPIFKSNNRVEYRFPTEMVVSSMMRLCDLTATTGAKFNALLGAKGLVRNIHLYDGATTLDDQRLGKHYNGFINLKNPLGASAIGCVRDKHNGSQVAKRTAYNSGSDTAHDNVSLQKINVDCPNSDSVPVWLNLQEHLPLLNSSVGLDTSVMKNLRLVVEIESNAEESCADSTKSIDLSAINPVLVVDELLGDSDQNLVRSQLSQGIMWRTIEHDQFILPSATANTRQTFNTRINGFNGKQVNRMLFAKTRSKIDVVDKTANVDNGYGVSGSVALEGEKFNLAVNGRNVFVDDGVDSRAKRVARTKDTWGNYFLYPQGNQSKLGNGLVYDANKDNGQLDYLGVMVAVDRLNDLQVNMERSPPTDADNKTGKEITYHCYAEVMKSLRVQGENYSVNYL